MRLRDVFRGVLEVVAISALTAGGLWLVLYLWIHRIASGRVQ